MPNACGQCGAPFVPKAVGQRYCQRACYAAFARQRGAESLVARFWAKVNKTETCWLWTASTTRGYGQFHAGRQDGRAIHVYAHRFAWHLARGPIPDNLSVLHRCDVPRCVNPNHLFLGTQIDNLADARQKGRLDESLPRDRKLTLADRLAIYEAARDRATGGALARRYRVSKTLIHHIRRGRFAGSPLSRVFERVPHVELPIAGEVR